MLEYQLETQNITLRPTIKNYLNKYVVNYGGREDETSYH